MKIDVYNQKGKSAGAAEVSEVVFGAPWRSDLVHQVVVSMQANARTPVAHTKDRSDVRGGGKKPWQQKGTGRARHGSRRSPIWKGGGVTFGPRNEKIYTKKINQKMRAQALYSALSQKVRDNEVLFVDAFDFSVPKTAQAREVLAALSGIKGHHDLASKKHNAVLIAIVGADMAIGRSFTNIGSTEVVEVRNLNPVSVLTHKYVVIVSPEEASGILAKRLTATAVKKAAATKEAKPEKKEKSEKPEKSATPTKKAPAKKPAAKKTTK